LLLNCKSHLGRALSPPSRQRMDSPTVCASCAVPTAYESNHSAMGTLHPHHSATFSLYITLCCPIPQKTFAPTGWDLHPHR